MEPTNLQTLSNNGQIKQPVELLPEVISSIDIQPDQNHFIEANTQSILLHKMEQQHIIPVFIKDNEPVISHSDFIMCTTQAINAVYGKENILPPNIRISHPIKGRIPEARNKPAKELLDHEKTIYYERMAFVIEIPSVHTDISGNRLNLTVGGVKAYNLDNLYARSGVDQHFKVFIGFQNKVCTNLCISTDGLQSNLKVKTKEQLYNAIYMMVKGYNAVALGLSLKELTNYSLKEQQFANIIGRCRMYKHLSNNVKRDLPEMNFGDGQINIVCKDYYTDQSFCRDKDGNINLWNLYNLFTGANKSSYIDSFLDRSTNAYQLIQSIKDGLINSDKCWFLN